MFSKFSNKIKFEHLNMEFRGKYYYKQKSRSRVNTLRDFQNTCLNKIPQSNKTNRNESEKIVWPSA